MPINQTYCPILSQSVIQPISLFLSPPKKDSLISIQFLFSSSWAQLSSQFPVWKNFYDNITCHRVRLVFVACHSVSLLRLLPRNIITQTSGIDPKGYKKLLTHLFFEIHATPSKWNVSTGIFSSVQAAEQKAGVKRIYGIRRKYFALLPDSGARFI